MGKNGVIELECEGEKLELLAERALHWPRQHTLVLSDIHLGKAESLRAEGIAVPAESGASDLERLAQLLARHSPRRVLILGDFIHQRRSWTLDLSDALSEFFNSHRDVAWFLVLGNHERGSDAFLKQLPLILIRDHKVEFPFVFRHGHVKQADAPGTFAMFGHEHPQVFLSTGALKVRCPCFVVGTRRLILPSFGSWTGGRRATLKPDDRVFATIGSEIFEVRSDS